MYEPLYARSSGLGSVAHAIHTLFHNFALGLGTSVNRQLISLQLQSLIGLVQVQRCGIVVELIRLSLVQTGRFLAPTSYVALWIYEDVKVSKNARTETNFLRGAL